MVGFRALVVYGSEEVAERLARALEALGVAVEVASDPEDAATQLRNTQFGAVVLDDELPRGGSLQVFEAIDNLEQTRPPVLMVSVPREALAQARQGSTDRLEYVGHPETDSEVERLALRIRSRLVSTGLAEEFGATPGHAPADAGPGGEAFSPGVRRDRRPYLAIVAVLVILLVLLFVLQRLPVQAVG